MPGDASRAVARLGSRIVFVAVALAACGKDDPQGTAAAPPDAATDANVAAVDAGLGALPDSAACVAPDVSKLPPPPWSPATPLGQGECTTALITRYLFDCLQSSASAQTCADFSVANTPAGRCGACITGATQGAGPVIVLGGITHLNTAGCIANAEGNGTAGTTCARAYNALDDCISKSCVCATTTPACAQAARAGACKSYADAVNCTVGASPAVAACLVGKTFPERYKALVALWCGGADAGN